MEDLRIRTELHEAWTNISLAENRLAQREYREAEDALRDAEDHYPQ
jgi:hypothetical protein